MAATTEKHAFQAEVNEVLSIVVNSLYSNREVFLRELISNASDALDKLSFRGLTDHDLTTADLSIDLIPSKDAKTLTIRDNGIGMTRQEVIDNLGTIARSGSKNLMRSLTGEQSKDLALIGQFGVGFYSAFLVADKVTVTTRSAGEEGEATLWESEAKGEYSVGDSGRERPGTNVILHLKEDAGEFLDEWTLKNLVRKYSDYVRYPIRLQVSREKPVGDEKKEDGTPVTETTLEWETINSASALWTRPRSEISDEQYEEFYKHLAHDWDKPRARTHFKVEGTHELTGLLFVPGRRPFDLFDRKPRGVRLFVKRVFIMEDCEELLPEYLRFVRGVVDSEDLPLNVSRELLQQDRTTQFIKKQVVGKVLGLLEELADEGETEVSAAATEGEGEGDGDGGSDEEPRRIHRYHEFWQDFGVVLKEGVHLDHGNRERLIKLLRYRSSAGAELTSLAEYVARMPADQPSIYYVTAASADAAANSPHIEALRQRGYEVLYMTDAIDEWVVESIPEFEDKKLVAAAKGSLDLPASDEDKKKQESQSTELEGMLGKIKETFGDHVKDVRLTDRLTDSPACLVSDEHGMSPQLERALRASGQEVPPQKRILELNPEHAVVRALQSMADDAERGDDFKRWSQLLFDSALVAEGSLPDDPTRLARGIAALMQDAAAKRD